MSAFVHKLFHLPLQQTRRTVACCARRPTVPLGIGVSTAVFWSASGMKTNDVSSWNVLLVQRGKEPFKGCYSLPGGSIEHGEQIRDGAAREVAEETGLPLSVNAVQGPALQQIPCKDWLLHVCYSFWHGEKPPVRAAGDVTEARFVRLEDLRTMHNITPGLYNTVLELAKVAAADDSK